MRITSDVIYKETVTAHLQQLDNVVPFVPRVLATIITDYIFQFDVYFKSSSEGEFSNNNQTVTIRRYANSSHSIRSLFVTQQPLSMIPSRWSFCLDHLSPDDKNTCITFGVAKLNDDGEYIDYREIRREDVRYIHHFGDHISKYTIPSQSIVSGSIITFHADIYRETVSIEIDGKNKSVAINDIQGLWEWVPYIECWTHMRPIVVTVFTKDPVPMDKN